MTDDRSLRELERRFKQSGAQTDRAEFEAERARLGVVETGFLRSREDAYRREWTAYLERGCFDFSLRGLVDNDERVVDIVSVGGRLQMLVYGGMFVYGGNEQYCMMTVDVNGKREVKALPPTGLSEEYAGLIVKGEDVFPFGVREVDNSSFSYVFMGGDSPKMVYGRAFDFVEGEGFLSAVVGDSGSFIVFVSDEQGMMRANHGCWPVGVFIQDNLVHVVKRDDASAHLCDGVWTPNDSRFARGVFEAQVGGLSRGYASRGGGLVRAHLEVPKQLLEALLAESWRGDD